MENTYQYIPTMPHSKQHGELRTMHVLDAKVVK